MAGGSVAPRAHPNPARPLPHLRHAIERAPMVLAFPTPGRDPRFQIGTARLFVQLGNPGGRFGTHLFRGHRLFLRLSGPVHSRNSSLSMRSRALAIWFVTAWVEMLS